MPFPERCFSCSNPYRDTGSAVGAAIYYVFLYYCVNKSWQQFGEEGRFDIMNFMELIDSLFRHGLGELPVFCSRLRGVYLGNMVYVKGRIFFKDQGLLQDMEISSAEPDWDQYVLGMVCYRKLLQWESLTFYGLDYCDLQTPVNPEYAESLKHIVTSEGERLYDFIGSIYRACHLMLDNGLLPVVLLKPINSKGSGNGLVIADLRALFPDGEKHAEIGEIIRDAIKKRATVEVDDIITDEIN